MIGIPGYSCVYTLRPRQSPLGDSSFPESQCSLRALFLPVFFALSLTLFAILLGGCGSASSAPIIPPPPPAPTSVTVLLSGAANDKLAQFGVAINTISLMDKAGNAVALFKSPNPANGGIFAPAEFFHLNGASEPLITVPVPQGEYLAAAVTVGYCSFTNVWVSSTGGVNEDTYAQGLCGQGTGATAVNLPAPITISGTAMALSLNLQLPQSYTLSGTGVSPPASYTISPVFTLSAIPISSQPTNEGNGKISGLQTQITSINAAAGSFVAQTPDGISLNLKSNSSSAYQGVAGFSSLTAGMLANMDIAIQLDGSLLATRIEVDDPASPMVTIGAQFLSGFRADQFITLTIEQGGCSPGGTLFCGNLFQFDGNTVFSVSQQFSNLRDLPFTPTFNAATLFLGQNVSVFSNGIPDAQSAEPASTITLMPQTLNGAVISVSSDPGFSVYTVAIAPYSLIPTLQASVSPARLTNPATVIVYADAGTQLLNSAPINSGAVLRFTGLIFNDNGTLRMDCSKVNDGLAE